METIWTILKWSLWLLLGALDVFFSTLAFLLALAIGFGIAATVVALLESVRTKLNTWNRERLKSDVSKAWDATAEN